MTETKQTVGQTTTVNTEKGTMSNVQVINKAKLDAWQTLAERMIEASANNRTVDRLDGYAEGAEYQLSVIDSSVELLFAIMNGNYDDESVQIKEDYYFKRFLSFNYFENKKILVDWLTNQIGIDKELAKEMANDAFGNEEED